MDYISAGLLFKIKKVLRYIGLYGVSRTLAKVRGQYHMRSTAGFDGPRWVNPRCTDPDNPERSVAIIGCGNYAFSTIAYYLAKERRHFLRSAYDPNRARTLYLCRAYGAALALSDWREILKDDQVKMVFIASNHASHAEYAIECIEAGKHVHIEKPHVVTADQMERLARTMQRHPEVKVCLGFNRPRSGLFRQLQGILGRETGPLVINWFIAGHEMADDHWYFSEKEGGLVLGNLCHWIDLSLHLVSLEKAFPCTVVPATRMGAKSDFVVSMMFGDGSCAAITFFSAKGHSFEGVREILNVHRGNAIANISDFQTLSADVNDRRIRHKQRLRDHGHQANLLNSFHVGLGHRPGENPAYVFASATLSLAVRAAIESSQPVKLP